MSHEQGLRQVGTLGQRGTQVAYREWDARREKGEHVERPDPNDAVDIPAFVAQLNALWRWAGSPGFKKSLQEKADQQLGKGHLSGTTVWRVLGNRQDLTRMQDPERFVRDLVTVLGADPAPWLTVLGRLLHPADHAEAQPEADGEVPPPRRRWFTRRPAVVAGVCLLVAGGVVAWSVAGDDTPVDTPVDHTRPVRIETGDGHLRLAVDRDTEQPGAAAVLTAGTAAAGWEMVAPHRNNGDFRQVRPVGKLLMCLEVVGGYFDDRARVQQWGCNGELHQYWKVEPDGSGNGTMRMVNFNSGQCLTVAGVRIEAGMGVVQRACDDQQAGQRWRFTATDFPAEGTTSSVHSVPGADPAEYPGGGKDKPCGGLDRALDPARDPWVSEPWAIRDSEDARTRGKVTLGAGVFGAVELYRADAVTAGVRETYYWADGWVTFTPKRFRMALQWTRVRGPGDWHTCAVPFTVEYDKPVTVALPRDRDRNGTVDVWFRICIAYTPEIGPSEPVVHCAGRY